MEMEFLMRMVSHEDDNEDTEDRRLRRLIDGVVVEDEVRKYVYKPYVLELDLVKAYGDYDGVHTELRTEELGYFYPQINFEHFKHIYVTATGRNIKNISDFKILKHK